jgi:leucyl aminopeptidase (aminopeptidase T)
MKAIVKVTALATVLAIVPARVARAAEKPDLKAISERIVTECVGVREGDLVLIAGDARDIDLVEDIGIAAARHGAAPLQLVARERTGPRYFTEVPEKYDGTRAAFVNQLAGIPTIYVEVQSTADPGLYKAIPGSRIATAGKSFLPFGETLMKRGVRRVYVGNGLFPTPATAKLLGVSEADLAGIFWGALATDPKKIQANGSAVKAAFAGAKLARVTHPNGTDIRFGVEGRPVILSDGVISPEQAAKGGPSAILYLPAGEAQIAPVPGTAEGKVVIDRMDWGIGPVEKLNWTFRAGKLVEYSAKPSPAFTRWKELYEAAGTGKDVFAGIDLGLHPGLRLPRGKPFLSYIPAGMVTVMMGDDTTLGGTNSSSYYAAGFLPGATVQLDGKPLVEKGVLKAAAK